MARLIYPTTALEIQTLLKAITQKNTEMGANSPITLLLTENNIDLVADKTAVNNAVTFNNASASLSRSSQNFTESRDHKTEPAMETIAGMAQLLKKFYKGKFTEVGKWGIHITATGKISYPPNPADKVTLIKAIETKHNSFSPNPSPLTAYLTEKGILLGALVTALTAAATYDEQSKTTAAEAEYDNEQRDILLADPLLHIATIGGFLMDFYKGNPRSLGLWGFDVDESTKKPKEVVSKLIGGEIKKLSNCIIGGTLENMGPGDAHVYKGKTTTGNPTMDLLEITLKSG